MGCRSCLFVGFVCLCLSAYLFPFTSPLSSASVAWRDEVSIDCFVGVVGLFLHLGTFHVSTGICLVSSSCLSPSAGSFVSLGPRDGGAIRQRQRRVMFWRPAVALYAVIIIKVDIFAPAIIPLIGAVAGQCSNFNQHLITFNNAHVSNWQL